MTFSKSEIKEMGDKLNLDWKVYNFDELYEGTHVELEHGTEGNWNVSNDDLETTMKIALAHLDELPDYYTRLKKMEEEGKIHHESTKRVHTIIEKFKKD